MLHCSKAVSNQDISMISDRDQCQWIWGLPKDSLVENHMGMIGISNSVVRRRTSHRSNVMGVVNWVIIGVNVLRGSKQTDLTLII